MSGQPTRPATDAGYDAPSGTLAAGRVLGGYRLEELLGRGGMGSVYRATQLKLGRLVALKLLLPEHAHRSGARQRFEREARVTAALRHPNAIEIFDFGEADGTLFLAMELLDGAPLRSIVSEELSVPELTRAIPIARTIADVLVVAHQIGLVHRDLKPENVFLSREADGSERLVVLDFGLAFVAGDAEIGRKTTEGMITGTPDYLSPEQALGIEVGPPSDVYSLGCLLYELLTGRVPFTGHPMQVLTKQMYAVPLPPSEIRRDAPIPHALETLVLSMLAKKPEERPTALEVRGALDALQEGRGFERARERIATEGRAARMISTIRPAAQSPVVAGDDAIVVAVIGALEGDLSVALAANGIVPFIVSEEQPVAGAHAIFAPLLTPEELAELKSQHRLPIVTDTGRDDPTRLPAVLRAGVDEVLPRPVRAEELARRVARAVRKARAAKR
jgi:CheY-like chemotaxis protein